MNRMFLEAPPPGVGTPTPKNDPGWKILAKKRFKACTTKKHCLLLDKAIQETKAVSGRRGTPGFDVGILFANRKALAFLVYRTTGRRGGTNLIINFCPFCGTQFHDPNKPIGSSEETA